MKGDKVVEVGVEHKTVIAHQLADAHGVKQMGSVMVALHTGDKEVLPANSYALT